MAWKEYCAEYWLNELWESMDRFTDCRDMTEILLKIALNTIQSIDQLFQELASAVNLDVSSRVPLKANHSRKRQPRKMYKNRLQDSHQFETCTTEVSNPPMLEVCGFL